MLLQQPHGDPEIQHYEKFQIASYEMNKVYENNREAYRITMVIKAKRVNEEGLLLMMLHDFPDITVNRIV